MTSRSAVTLSPEKAGWSILGHWNAYSQNEPVGENGWQCVLLQNPI